MDHRLVRRRAQDLIGLHLLRHGTHYGRALGQGDAHYGGTRRTAWRLPWRGWDARSWRATREFPGNAADAEKHSPDLKHTCNTGSDRSIEGRKTLMNKTRREKAVPRRMPRQWRGGSTPRRGSPCPAWSNGNAPSCRYFFAAPASSQELCCQDCVENRARLKVSQTPGMNL